MCIFAAVLMTFACSAASGSEWLVIDSFEYAGKSEAQEQWKPQAESPPVELMPHAAPNGKQALLLPCDFSRKPERCYWDREVKLDLTKFGRFSLWVYVKDPQAVGHGTIYFQSGNGWFGRSLTLAKEGWQKVSAWKSDFTIEDSPSGWDQIDRIRLSVWNTNNTDTVVAVDDIEAVADEIMIVLGDLTMRKKSSEARSVQQYADLMAKTLERLGLEFSVVNDTDVEAGALSGCKLALFPHNPDTSEKEHKAIERFVKAGGKIMLFYSLPESLAELIGLENIGWVRQEYAGQFSNIKLNPKVVEGLPEMIIQGSPHTRTVKPASPEAKVIGEWVDTEGKKTGVSAITFHPNGTFMGHVLMHNDMINKGQMLIALFGKLVPGMRQSLVKAALQNVGRRAGFDSFSEASEFVMEKSADVPEEQRAEALEHLAKSKDLLTNAEKASEDSKYGDALKMAREATKEFQEAFFRSFPPKEGDFRALWCHSAFGIPGWDWDKAIEVVKTNGFNAIVPNMLWGGLAYYPSKVLPVAEEVKEKGDQIEQCLKACRKHGVQVHVWKVNWNLSRAPEEFVDKLRKEDRLQKDMQGNEVRWLCPSEPKNLKLELDSMLEIVRKYDVDGVHFDYIRYPNRNSCYCANCRKRFEKSSGVKVKNWPEDVITGAHAEKFVDWKCGNITALVKAVSEQARKINPKVKISAAVFRDYPRCRQNVGQDWKVWIESGYLDFVCPMDYTSDDDQFRNWVMNQIEVVNKRIPLYPGVGASAPGLPPEQVATQIQIARELGVSGFIIFNYDLSVAKDVLPALSKGLTKIE